MCWDASTVDKETPMGCSKALRFPAERFHFAAVGETTEEAIKVRAGFCSLVLQRAGSQAAVRTDSCAPRRPEAVRAPAILGVPRRVTRVRARLDSRWAWRRRLGRTETCAGAVSARPVRVQRDARRKEAATEPVQDRYTLPKGLPHQARCAKNWPVADAAWRAQGCEEIAGLFTECGHEPYKGPLPWDK